MKSGVDARWLSQDFRPQDDLYRHVNGKWIAETEIPNDRAAHGSFYALRDHSEQAVHAIIEECAASNPTQGSEAQKVGDLYASFMDEEAIEERGIAPLYPLLASIEKIGSPNELIDAFGFFYKEGAGAPFGMYVYNDAKKSDEYIVYLYQDGLGLPDESYYREDQYADIRHEYVQHIRRMFDLAGIAESEAQAQAIFELERTLAKSHWDVVKDRDRTATYNKFSRQELDAATPGFNWSSFLEHLNVPASAFDQVIVREPSFFTDMAHLVQSLDLSAWKSWLRWHVLSGSAAYLSKSFVDESFAFYGTALSGTPQNKDRWKRGVALIEGVLGEAVGKLYVEKYFPPEAKDRMRTLVANLLEAYRQDIETLDWMGQATKAKALEKLGKFTSKIGYPDKWRDYSSLVIERGDLLGNIRRAELFELRRNVEKLGKPIDRSEWLMTPQTVNAYYNPVMNEIVFPAAILQPPFFDMDADDAVNYGTIGAVIGHEIGHGFDDQGSKFDGDGNLVNWWTDEDRSRFEERTSKLIEQYDALEPEEVPGHKVNGSLTIGENIGDLGGITVAYQAYKISLGDKEPGVIDGFSGWQRFFIGWAQGWRSKVRNEEMIRRLAIDPHSPSEFRCNAVLRNFNEFYDAWGVTEADEMWLDPSERVRIW